MHDYNANVYMDSRGGEKEINLPGIRVYISIHKYIHTHTQT